MRILIVEDEPELNEQLRRTLEAQKYSADCAYDGEQALDRLAEVPYDLVLLDVMLPKLDGFALLREARNMGIDSPVLMLTARTGTGDKIKGLDSGADDYLTKPFSTDELLARVRALLRRAGGQTASVLRAGSLSLDTVKREVAVDGKAVELTQREFSILEFLMYNKNRAVSRFSLAEHVWGDDFEPFSMSNFMDVHIKNLRKKINAADGESVVKTIRGVGYIIRDGQE
ncbi:response regulator transcription factor [Geovibrio thiophilus]|uniref:Response regulator transcription factor n=1 Tax=Geovibrio thiophilus TaxID=139438 RepID=A0A3R5Y8N8_9BACT|nr:response regulator transcription factor [Geovibrio thiophilus]QAR34357.1 response regulator transcription factor [Geovibrio thiophilus]